MCQLLRTFNEEDTIKECNCKASNLVQLCKRTNLVCTQMMHLKIILFLSFLQDEFSEIFIPDFIKTKEKGKNKDEIRRKNQLEVGEGNKAEDVAETEEHYVNALQMGGLL